MSDLPVPVPRLPLADRLLAAAERAFAGRCFEVMEDGDAFELFVVLNVTDGGHAANELSVAQAETLHLDADPGDELLFQLVRLEDEVQLTLVDPTTRTVLEITERALLDFAEELERELT